MKLLDLESARPVEDLVEFSLDEHRGGRRLMLNMVASLDGATAFHGGATGLADDDDRAMFMALRSASDVILVGAETVRAEDYGPVRLGPAAREARRRRGLEPLPELAIVSRTLDLDPDARVFSDPERRPLILTGADAPADRRGALEDRAEILEAGRIGADPETIVDVLTGRGHEVVLCEGGPTLNGQLVAADLVDEIDLTLSPLMVAGQSSRVAHAPEVVSNAFHLSRILVGDEMLFVRYLRD